jgi:hypothetical protein
MSLDCADGSRGDVEPYCNLLSAEFTFPKECDNLCLFVVGDRGYENRSGK